MRYSNRGVYGVYHVGQQVLVRSYDGNCKEKPATIMCFGEHIDNIYAKVHAVVRFDDSGQSVSLPLSKLTPVRVEQE